MDEINTFDAGKTEEERGAIPSYKKTSMKEAVEIFETFLFKLTKDNAASRRDESGEYNAFKMSYHYHFSQIKYRF